MENKSTYPVILRLWFWCAVLSVAMPFLGVFLGNASWGSTLLHPFFIFGLPLTAILVFPPLGLFVAIFFAVIFALADWIVNTLAIKNNLGTKGRLLLNLGGLCVFLVYSVFK